MKEDTWQKYKKDLPLWTNDKALCEGIKNKGFDHFVTTEDLLKEI